MNCEATFRKILHFPNQAGQRNNWRVQLSRPGLHFHSNNEKSVEEKDDDKEDKMLSRVAFRAG